MNGEKTIVFGLDGAHFELINSWIEEGELPNIQRSIEEGITGDLQSVLPPVTSPNWKAYATGKNPGKLGIFWWENVDIEGEKVYYPDKRKYAQIEYWEILGEKSSAGVVNVPTTYPPREVDPFIVSGAPDAKNTGYTHPPELEDELHQKLDYKVTMDTPIQSRPEEAASEIHKLIDLRFRAGKYLLEEYDPEFLQITTFYLNSLHHFFWDDEITLKGWKIVDEHLGYFLDEGYNIILMSDHGATEIETVFHINSWLESEGYLTSDMRLSGAFGKLGFTKENLIEITTKLGVRDFAKRYAPMWLLSQIPSEEGEVERERKTLNVKWRDTSVLASGQGPVYIRDDSNYDQIRDDLMDKLSNLTSPDGKPIAKNVYRGEDIYEGQYSSEAPDVVVEQADGVHIQGGLGREEIFTSPESDGWKGENKRDGLFIATGPDFSTGSIDEISILDLAPTLLHLHDCEIPSDFDGDVKKQVYQEDCDSATRDVKYSKAANTDVIAPDSDQRTEDVQGRLQDLGYLE